MSPSRQKKVRHPIGISENTFNPDWKVESLIREYLLRCELCGHTVKTLESKGDNLNDFVRYLSSLKIKNIGDVKPHIVEGYLRSKQQKGNAAHTVHNFHKIIRAFFSYLVEQSENSYTSPLAKIRPPKLPTLPPKSLTLSEIQKCIKACGRTTAQRRLAFLILMAFDSGLRIGELVSLRLDDIDDATGAVLVRRGKNGKPRSLLMGRKTLLAFLKYRRENGTQHAEFLFTAGSGQLLTTRNVQRAMSGIGNKVGFRLSPHRLRHSCARAMIMAGSDIGSVQNRLGHSSPQMALHYASLHSQDALIRGQQFAPGDRL